MGTIKEAIEKTQEFLVGRMRSYQLVFKKDDEAVKKVLADLEKFCRANESCFHPDPRIHAALEGRREVFLRIRDHIELSPEQFWEKYGRKTNDNTTKYTASNATS